MWLKCLIVGAGAYMVLSVVLCVLAVFAAEVLVAEVLVGKSW